MNKRIITCRNSDCPLSVDNICVFFEIMWTEALNLGDGEKCLSFKHNHRIQKLRRDGNQNNQPNTDPDAKTA